jgi:ribosomal protein S18 acetylase RimI-like enzyme
VVVIKEVERNQVDSLMKVVRNLSRGSIISFGKRCIKKVIREIARVETSIIFEIDLERPIKKVQCAKEISFRFGNQEDIKSMSADDGYSKHGRRYFLKRYTMGDRFLLALLKGRVIGYVSIMKDCMELSKSRHILLASKRVYIYKTFVNETFRGLRIFNAMVKEVIEILRKESMRYLVDTVSKNNVSSLEANERMEFRRIGHIELHP